MDFGKEIKRLIIEEEAASLLEYALVIAAGAVVATALKPTFHALVRC